MWCVRLPAVHTSMAPTHIKICVSNIYDEIVYEYMISDDMFYTFLVDGYKQYAHRYFISDFLLFADNVNQPDLLPIFPSMFSRHPSTSSLRKS